MNNNHPNAFIASTNHRRVRKEDSHQPHQLDPNRPLCTSPDHVLRNFEWIPRSAENGSRLRRRRRHSAQDANGQKKSVATTDPLLAVRADASTALRRITQCRCGWARRFCPQVYRSTRQPISAPRCFGTEGRVVRPNAHFDTFLPYRASSSRTTLRRVDFKFSSLPSTYSRRAALMSVW